MRVSIDLAKIYSYISNRYSALRQQPWFGGVRNFLAILIVLAVLTFFTATLARSWSQVSPYLRQMNLGYALVAQLFTIMAFVLGGVAWFFTQIAFGLNTTVYSSMAVHIVSNAAKYVPGFGWQYLSKGYLIRDSGFSASQISLVIATEVALLFSAGIAIGSFGALFLASKSELPWRLPNWLWLVLVGLILLVTWTWYRLADRRMQRHGTGVELAGIASAWSADLLGWGAYAMACWCFAAALSVDLSLLGFAYCLVALVAAGLVSTAILVVPGGFGIREAALAYLLVGMMPFPLGVIVSLLMRISLMISEILGLVGVVLLRQLLPGGPVATYSKWIIGRNTPK